MTTIVLDLRIVSNAAAEPMLTVIVISVYSRLARLRECLSAVCCYRRRGEDKVAGAKRRH